MNIQYQALKYARNALFSTIMATFPGIVLAADCAATFPEFTFHADTFAVACSAIPEGQTIEIKGQPSNGKVGFFDKNNDGKPNELIFYSTNSQLPGSFDYVLKDEYGVMAAGTSAVPYFAVNKTSAPPFCGTTMIVFDTGSLTEVFRVCSGINVGFPASFGQQEVDEIAALCANSYGGFEVVFGAGSAPFYTTVVCLI